MAAPEYMNGLRKSWELGVGVYSLLHLVYLVDGTKLWRLTKQLNDERKSHNNTGSRWTAPTRQTSCKQIC